MVYIAPRSDTYCGAFFTSKDSSMFSSLIRICDVVAFTAVTPIYQIDQSRKGFWTGGQG